MNSKHLIVLAALIVGLLAGCGGGGGGGGNGGAATDTSGGTGGGGTGGGGTGGGDTGGGGSTSGGSTGGGDTGGGSTGGGDTGGSTGGGSTGGGDTGGSTGGGSTGGGDTGGSTGGGSTGGGSTGGGSTGGGDTGGGSTGGGTGGGATAPVGTTWSSVKFGGGGYVPGLVFHPANANVLYARTDIGGAYRWNPANASWIPITDSFGVNEGRFMGIESIALDPNDDRLVYMVTGMYTWGGNARLYISTDRGDHWQQKVDLPFAAGGNHGGRAIGERLMVDPNLPSTLYFGSRVAGLWKSTDSGKTWSQVTSLSSTQMTDAQITASEGSAKGVGLVVFDTSTKGTGTATQTIYAAIEPDYVAAAGLNSSLYKSTNGGTTWSAVATPATGQHIPHMVRAADGVFYVVFTTGSGPGAGGPAALYKFDGTNWTLLNSTTPTQWTSFGMGGVSVSGSGATTRIALGITNSWGAWDGRPNVALSDDAGKTWRELTTTSSSGWTDDVEIDPSNPDRILYVYGGGVWETKNASAATPSWNLMVEGIEEVATVSLTTPPPGAPYLFLNSAMDVGMLVHTDVTQPPTLGPAGNLSFGTGFCADMAWSDPSYIVAVGYPTKTAAGVYSTDSGKTWTAFATNHPAAMTELHGETNVAVTKKNHAIWAPGNAVPYYTTDNGATWQATNLPALERMSVNRAYRVVADRQNPDRVYAYDSGGAWWGSAANVYYSTDGGHTFTRSTAAGLASLRVNSYQTTSIAVNPYVEGDVWLADGNSVYHSVDGGVSWTKLTTMASVWGSNPTWQTPELFGANRIALGKAKAGAPYSAALYMVGTVGGVWGVHRSDDAGATWLRINDDDHQFGGIDKLAADHNVYGRLFVSAGGRGLHYAR